MSWSASYETKKEGITAHGVTTDESSKAYAMALDAAGLIIASEVLGSNDKNYKVNISGHSNPGNEPTPGWANDCVTINIYQLGEEE